MITTAEKAHKAVLFGFVQARTFLLNELKAGLQHLTNLRDALAEHRSLLNA
jgi:hypothetical protein